MVTLRSRPASLVARPAVFLPALAAIVSAQALLLTPGAADVRGALALALKAGLGAWIVLTLMETGRALAGGAPLPAEQEGRPAVPFVVVLGTGVLIAALTWPALGRLVATLLCYGLLAGALGWVVFRRAGAAQAARALLALSAFAAVAAGADVRPGPRIVENSAGSAYRWVAGWPADGWVLRHELQPREPLPAAPMVLKVPLADRYDGPARVFAALNGYDLGPATLVDGRHLHVTVPADLLASSSRLAFELRQRPSDPRLRITAHRWGAAATAGPDASSFFDGLRWLPGTFNDATGRRQPGLYVLQLDPQ